MNEKVGVTLRVSPVTRVWLAECARLDHRTVSAYVEAFVEADAKAKKIADLDVKAKKPKKEPKQNPYEIDTGEVLTKASWTKWLQHVHKMNEAPLNHAAAMQHFKEFCRHYEECYDCDALVAEITDRYTWKFPYIPNDWKREKANGGSGSKPWWHDAK